MGLSECLCTCGALSWSPHLIPWDEPSSTQYLLILTSGAGTERRGHPKGA